MATIKKKANIDGHKLFILCYNCKITIGKHYYIHLCNNKVVCYNCLKYKICKKCKKKMITFHQASRYSNNLYF